MDKNGLSKREKIGLGILIILVVNIFWFKLKGESKQPILSWGTEKSLIQKVPRQGGVDGFFFYVSDLHFGSKAVKYSITTSGVKKEVVDITQYHEKLLAQMISIVGKKMPVEAGGMNVREPASLIITGDLTQDGYDSEWIDYLKYFGKNGKFPWTVWDLPGNHDLRNRAYTRNMMKMRQGGSLYIRDYKDLRFISLGEAPDQTDLKWLKNKLIETGTERPIIIMMHFPLHGPFAKNWFTRNTFPVSLANILKPFNIIAILHGHFHGSGYYKWNGIDVYNIGSVKHSHKDFAVFHVSDTHFTFGAWNIEMNDWWWIHRKPLNGHKDKEILKILKGEPWVPYPEFRD